MSRLECKNSMTKMAKIDTPFMTKLAGKKTHTHWDCTYLCSPHQRVPLGELVLSAGLQSLFLERFSFECRKVIGFAFTTLRDWLNRFAPLFHPIRSKTKTNCVIASRALRQLPVITSSFDWFTVLSQANRDR